jgi:hypothetical protein
MLAFLALTLCPLAAWSQNPEAAEPIDARLLAQAYLLDNRPDLACALLEVAYGPEATQPEVLLMLATCSRETEQLDDAVTYYRRLIALEPQAVRPRVELAGLYLRLGQVADSREQLAAAAQLEQPAESAALLERLVQALAPIGQPAAVATGPKRWRIELAGGLVYDSNVNTGPSSDTIAAVIGGVPLDLTLAKESRPQEASGLSASVNGRYLQPLSSRFALLAQGTLAKTGYFGHSEYDTDSAAAALALIYRKARLTASLQPSIRLVRRDNDTEATAYGSTLRLTRGLGNGVSLTGSLGYVYSDVAVNEDRDNHGVLASLGASKAIGEMLEVGAEYVFQDERADEAIHSRTLHGPVLFAAMRPSSTVTVAASYRYRHARHDARQAIFAVTREDDQHVLGLNADWDVSAWTLPGLRLRGQYTYIDNRSSLDVHEYDRSLATLGLALRF